MNRQEGSSGVGQRVVRCWRGGTIVAVGVFALAATVLAACSPARSMPSPRPVPSNGAFVVEVVDANGAPLAGAEVEGMVDFNPGPVASTCCTEKLFATGKTSENGVATLAGAPITFRVFHFRASYRDWPPRKATAASQFGRLNVVRIALEPARNVEK